MAKTKTIKVEIGPKELAQILYEWTNQRPTPAQAERLLASIQELAQERLENAAFTIITNLTDGF